MVTLDRFLELTQDISGLAFSSFILIHLASPIGAAIVKTNYQSIASNIQLAARVVYQDRPSSEAGLVWIPLGTHILIGLIRRISRINRKRKLRAQIELRAQLAQKSSSAGIRSPFKLSTSEWLISYLPTTAHQISAYLSIPLLFDHIFHHRLSANPSLRSFQFVSFNLQQYPIIHSIKYFSLLASSLYHTLIGLDQVFSRLFSSSPKSVYQSQSSLSLRFTYLGIIATLGIGLRKLARDPIPTWIAKRFL